MKILINNCFGGFGFSDECERRIREALNLTDEEYFKNIRTNPTVISIVEGMGEEANTEYSKLKVVEIPDNSYYEIYDYDGKEFLFYSEAQIHVI